MVSDMKSDTKSVQIAFRVTAAEKRALERAARRAKETTSEFCRRIALAAIAAKEQAA